VLSNDLRRNKPAGKRKAKQESLGDRGKSLILRKVAAEMEL
jgi:hypothetical protein